MRSCAGERVEEPSSDSPGLDWCMSYMARRSESQQQHHKATCTHDRGGRTVEERG